MDKKIKWSDTPFVRMKEFIEPVPETMETDFNYDELPMQGTGPESFDSDEELHNTPAAMQELMDQSSYADAVHFLNEHHQDLHEFVPLGSGSFDAWWLGDSEYVGEGFPEMPARKITLQDVKDLSSSSWGMGELASLLSNIFYRNSVKPDMVEPDAMKEIIIKGSEDHSDYPDVLADYFSHFIGEMSADEMYEIINSPAALNLLAKSLVKALY